MAVIVVDASVMIGFFDGADRHHRRAVASLTASRDASLVLPASAYAEILVGPARRGVEAVAVVDEALAALAIHVEPVTREIAHRAAVLRAGHAPLRLPDALVLATADVLAAAAVLTADRAWPRISRRARVI
ncbi:MAG: type II toxin-antitoxin system VapC family toxin [Candidatus Rokuibacteriota bacterium]